MVDGQQEALAKALSSLTTTISDIDARSQTRFDYLAEEIEELRNGHDEDVVESQRATLNASESDERLSRVEQLSKWANPWRQILLLAGMLLTVLITVYTVTRDYAKETLIETVRDAHKEDIEPSVKTINGLKQNGKATEEGVKALIEDRKHHRQIEQIQFELALHVKQYDEKVKKWEAKKRRGQKPGKEPRHLQLEALLNTLNATRPPLPETKD